MEKMFINTTCPDILIVDDSRTNLHFLSSILTNQGYRVITTTSGRETVDLACSQQPNLIILDVELPDINGFDVCHLLKENNCTYHIPVIFISAMDEMDDKIRGFESGGVDYITKPFQTQEVLMRVKTHLTLHQLQKEMNEYNQSLQDVIKKQVKIISESQMATIFALAKLSESRDDDTGKHLERVQTFCKLLAIKLQDQKSFKSQINDVFIDNIYHASPLHDIGKVGIRDEILLKPARLTPDEFEIMKTHTWVGAHTLEEVKKRYPDNAFIDAGIAIAHFHHEKWNGSGYPEGLKGNDIPLNAQIMAMADIYDALRSKRCYKPAFSHEESCKIISGDSGVQFNPEMVESFLEIEGEFAQIRDHSYSESELVS